MTWELLGFLERQSQKEIFLRYLFTIHLFFTLPLTVFSLVLFNNYYSTLVENSQESLLIRSKTIAAHLENSIKDRVIPSEKSPAFLQKTIQALDDPHESDSILLEWNNKNPILVYVQIQNQRKVIWKYSADFLMDKILDAEMSDPTDILFLQNRSDSVGMSSLIEEEFEITEEWRSVIDSNEFQGLAGLIFHKTRDYLIVRTPMPRLPFQIVVLKDRAGLDRFVWNSLAKIAISFLLVLGFVTIVSLILARSIQNTKREETKLHTLVQNLPLGACLVDRDFHPIITNNIFDQVIAESPKIQSQLQNESIFRIRNSQSREQKYVWEIDTDKTWEVTLSPWFLHSQSPEGYIWILRDLTAKKIIFEHEMELARKIQEDYLPNECDTFEGLRFQAFYKPYLQVGGDYYDYLQLDENRYLFVMADVIGHGLQAAMMMTVVKVLFLQIASTSNDPKDILTRMSTSIIDNLPSGKGVVPLHFLILDMAQKTFQYANAGHPGMVFQYDKNSEVYEVYDKLNPVLGLMHYVTPKIIEGSFGNNTRFFMYTDGLMDVHNPRKELFGIPKIQDFILASRHKSPSEFTKKLEEEIIAFSEATPYPDDITWFVIDST